MKGNALYGEVFDSWSALEQYMADWLDHTANVRTHATTGEIPQHHYERLERLQMKVYLSPAIVQPNGQGMTRKADMTGLISYRSNKYSVPMAYQRRPVGVEESGQQLHILICKAINGLPVIHCRVVRARSSKIPIIIGISNNGLSPWNTN